VGWGGVGAQRERIGEDRVAANEGTDCDVGGVGGAI